MKAQDIMTWPVISITPDAPVQSAIRLMLQHRISGVPVVEKDGRLVGMLTEGDLLRRSETGTERRRPRWLEFLLGPGRLAGEYTHTHGRKVEEIMTADPIVIDDQLPVQDVVEVMEKNHIKRVPVMRGNVMVGILSRANLVQALASVADSVPATTADDAAIRDKLLSEIDHQPWAPKGLINVTVKNAIVELWGSITDEREREALHVLAENMAGVKEVRDHLSWVEPMSGMVMLSDEDTRERAKAS